MNTKRKLIETIVNLSEKLKEIGEKELFKKNDITILQFNILGVLLEEKTKTIQDIKLRLIVSAASLSQTLNRMEKKGFIKRIYGKGDKRYVNVEVLQKGKDLYYDIREKYEKLIDEKINMEDKKIEKFLDLLLDFENRLFNN